MEIRWEETRRRRKREGDEPVLEEEKRRQRESESPEVQVRVEDVGVLTFEARTPVTKGKKADPP